MKTRSIFLFILMIGILCSFQAKSQAEVVFDKTVVFKDGQGGVFESTDSKTTLTPSGNMVKTATFELPEDHFLVPEKWSSYIAGRIKETNSLGEEVYMYDFNVKIQKNGKFKVVYHSNGAGSIFPAKYK